VVTLAVLAMLLASMLLNLILLPAHQRVLPEKRPPDRKRTPELPPSFDRLLRDLSSSFCIFQRLTKPDV